MKETHLPSFLALATVLSVAPGLASAGPSVNARAAAVVQPVSVVPYAAIAVPQAPGMLAIPGLAGLQGTLVVPQLDVFVVLPQAASSLTGASSVLPLESRAMKTGDASSLPHAAFQPGGSSVVPADGAGRSAHVKAQADRMSRIAERVAGHIEGLGVRDSNEEGAKDLGGQILSALQSQDEGAGSAAIRPPAQKDLSGGSSAVNARGRSAPLVSDVSFNEGISDSHKSLFQETLKRRKAGWSRQLQKLGVKLEGPVAPVLNVRSAKDVYKGAKVEYVVDWMQGETHVGTFKAVIALKDLETALSRQASPAVAKEDVIRIRFLKTVIRDVGGLNMEAEVSDPEIAAFLEEKGLRVVSRGWKGDYEVAVTGQDQAADVARTITGQGIVLYASPAAVDIPEERTLRIAFKKATVVDTGINAEVSVREGDIAPILRAYGLTVIEIEQDGDYLVGTELGVPAQAIASRLLESPFVLYASAVKTDMPEDQQSVVTFREKGVVDLNGILVESVVSEDDIAKFFRRYGLSVLDDLGGGSYRIGSNDKTGRMLAAGLAKESIVASAVAVGSLKDEAIKASAAGVAGYKGRPWSETEYNLAHYEARHSLALRGATEGQLKLYDKLCAEAPVKGGGFNPWSGD